MKVVICKDLFIYYIHNCHIIIMVCLLITKHGIPYWMEMKHWLTCMHNCVFYVMVIIVSNYVDMSVTYCCSAAVTTCFCTLFYWIKLLVTNFYSLMKVTVGYKCTEWRSCLWNFSQLHRNITSDITFKNCHNLLANSQSFRHICVQFMLQTYSCEKLILQHYCKMFLIKLANQNITAQTLDNKMQWYKNTNL